MPPERSRNLLRLGTYVVGDTEVPADYYLWSFISLISACVADRVWVTKMGKKLPPNLYIALIGKSGLGKGEAIDAAVRYARDNPRINLYAGKITAQKLVDRLGRGRTSDDGKDVEKPRSRLWLVTPEVSMSLRRGEQADDFVRHMTEMYTGRDYPLRDGTITRGEVVVRNYCLNWVLGTTEEWLMDVVDADAVSGGFFGRMVSIKADYDFAKRIPNPRPPADADEVHAIIAERVDQLTYLQGEFEVSPDAQQLKDQWYMTREVPSDPSLIPAWKRQDDLILKLAMVASLAQGFTMQIERGHIDWARRMTDRIVHVAGTTLSDAASATPETVNVKVVSDYIRDHKRILKSTLMRFAVRHGLDDFRLRAVLATLETARQVAQHATPHGLLVEWIARRRLPKED